MNEIKKIPDSPVCYIKGVGEKRAKLLEKLGITTALQLAEHYPRGYIDFNETTAISDLVNDGENHVVKRLSRRNFLYTTAGSIYSRCLSATAQAIC